VPRQTNSLFQVGDVLLGQNSVYEQVRDGRLELDVFLGALFDTSLEHHWATGPLSLASWHQENSGRGWVGCSMWQSSGCVASTDFGVHAKTGRSMLGGMRQWVIRSVTSAMANSSGADVLPDACWSSPVNVMRRADRICAYLPYLTSPALHIPVGGSR